MYRAAHAPSPRFTAVQKKRSLDPALLLNRHDPLPELLLLVTVQDVRILVLPKGVDIDLVGPREIIFREFGVRAFVVRRELARHPGRAWGGVEFDLALHRGVFVAEVARLEV